MQVRSKLTDNEQPFDSSTPFVEKEGYAWCVGCHTNRYSAKCKRCRKPVTNLVVKALGAEWHDECFVCIVSLPVTPSDQKTCADPTVGVQRSVRRRPILPQRTRAEPRMCQMRGSAVEGLRCHCLYHRVHLQGREFSSFHICLLLFIALGTLHMNILGQGCSH